MNTNYVMWFLLGLVQNKYVDDDLEAVAPQCFIYDMLKLIVFSHVSISIL